MTRKRQRQAGTTHSTALFELQDRLKQMSRVLSQIEALLESCIKRDAYWTCPSAPSKRSAATSGRGSVKSKSRRSGHEP